MAFFSINEFVDLVVMTLVLGYVFKDMFGSKFFLPSSRKKMADDPVAYYRALGKSVGNKLGASEGFKTAIVVAGPAVILHELGHKVIAMSFGLSAEFNAAYFWLALALMLKMFNFGFVFFVPAYVSIIGSMTPAQGALTAFAGPGVNLVIWLLCLGLFKHKGLMKKYKKYLPIIWMTGRINMFLFLFNMLPIPMFDGWQVYNGLFHALF